jgi:Fe-S oxidoreductase
MSNARVIRFSSVGKPSERLGSLDDGARVPLPAPYDRLDEKPLPALSAELRASCECSLDDTVAVPLPRPKSAEDEQTLVRGFLSGLDKLFSKSDNWTFLEPLVLSVEHCAKCHTCAHACHLFEESGENELYRPSFRSEILRRLYFKHKSGGSLLSQLVHGDIDINWTTIARLLELAYRCNLCRRCAQTCPIGVDNGLIAHEIRKLFSMELGIAPKEIHEKGSMLQIRVGSSTGMSPAAVRDNVDFIDEDTSEKTGIEVKTRWDVAGADVLLMHNAGEILSWPDNPGAFALVLEQAGISWTLSSDLVGYDAINYGLWYDDAQFARVALKHAQVAKKLGVKKIVIGECGHAHKSMMVIADRIFTGELNIPRESSLTLLADIVSGGKLKLDPRRNDFPVTLHDPCNIVRLMGVVEPQRRILRTIAPRFREMTPHGVNNYCCGGGSGFAIMTGHNFADWRIRVASRRKFRQILEAFADDLDPSHPKYVCAPCSNCKGAIRDILRHYQASKTAGIHYGGIVELIVNAMTDVKPGFINFDEG